MRLLAGLLAVLAIVAAGLSAWVSTVLLIDSMTTQAELFGVRYTLPWAPIAAVGLVVVAALLAWIALYREPVD